MDNGKDWHPDRIAVETTADAREIDKVLAQAGVPPIPEGAVARLMTRIVEQPQEAREASVILFRPKAQAARHNLLRFAAALPLAASLALGIYLGAKGTLDFMLPTAITGVAMSEEPLDDLGGVSEADDYAAENLS